MLKRCEKCGAETERKKSGECKPCSSAYNKAWYVATREKVKAKSRAWAAANPEKNRARSNAWYAVNSERRKATNRAWVKANPDKVKATKQTWVKANPEKVKASSRARSANPAKLNAMVSRRRAAKIQAAPAWANKFYVEEIYDLAQLRTKATGFRWVVDHIVPLQSKSVCGLHWELNLDVIPEKDNAAKGNRHWPDMP